MSNSLVSIVIPVFNKEKWITQTLLTVYNQTYPNWECLIIDDGSTDGSLAVVSEFVTSHPGNWRVISQENFGQTRTRNLGIELAEGEFIAFLDGDDLWLPSKLELQMVTMLANPNFGLLLTSYVIFSEGQLHNFRVVFNGDARKMISRWLKMTGFGGLIESTGLMKKTTLEKFGKYSEFFSMTAGLDLCLEIISEMEVGILKEPLVLYRLSPGQLHKQEDLLVKDLNTVTKKYATSDMELRRLKQSHASYLFWSNCRVQGARFFAISVIKSLALLRFRNLTMLYFLLSRNVVALYRGYRQRVKILGFLNNSSSN
ncbi:MAG: glycosyltransferase family 2 protein [Candidatus Planktophila sp.]|nr:glycosyltransferase family 2 protein [Candidatus Planktophila sp.]